MSASFWSPGSSSSSSILSEFLLDLGDTGADCTAELQAAINEFASISAVLNEGIGRTLWLNGLGTISSQILLPSILNGFTIRGGALVASATGSWSVDTAMIKMAGARCAVLDMILDGSNVCSGIEVTGANESISRNSLIHHHAFGIKLNGSSGGTKVDECRVHQWNSSDAQFATQANWTSKGIWALRNDDSIHGCLVFWNAWNLYFDNGAGTTQVSDCHIFGGGSGVFIPVDTKNVYVDAGAGNIHFDHVYFDNGEVDLYNDNVAFTACSALHNTVNVTNSYFIKVFANGQTNPFALISTPWEVISSVLTDGTIPFFSFVASGINVWTGSYTNLPLLGPNPTINGNNVIVHPKADGSRALGLFSPALAASGGCIMDFICGDSTFATPNRVQALGDTLQVKSSKLRVQGWSANQGTVTLDANDAYGLRYDLANTRLAAVANSVDCFFITAGKSVLIGALSVLANAATDGFLYVPTVAGTPSGVPTAFTGKTALAFDSTAVKLWAYTGGAWKSVALT